MSASGNRTTWVIFALVLLTAISTLIPSRGPALPGVLRLSVMPGAGDQRILRAVTPLSDYFGSSLRRTVRPHVVDVEQLRAGGESFDIALLPARLAEQVADSEILAWAKGGALSGASMRPFVLYPRDHPWQPIERPRLICGDQWTAAGGHGASDFLAREGHPLPDGFGTIHYGGDPYDHREAIQALVYGAFDLAVVRERDLRAAIERGSLDPTRFVYGPAGDAEGGFVLVAGPRLSLSARRTVRDAALNLDLYRYDAKNLRVATVLSALGLIGLEGFSPRELLPSLRP